MVYSLRNCRDTSHDPIEGSPGEIQQFLTATMEEHVGHSLDILFAWALNTGYERQCAIADMSDDGGVDKRERRFGDQLSKSVSSKWP